MAFVLADRVRETTTTTGTGAVTLSGAYTGFQSFSSAIGNGNNTYYTIANVAVGEWEVGIGTYTSASNTLSRTTVLASSNAGAAVSFSTGSKDVFVTQPAERAVYVDPTNTYVSVPALATAGQITSTVATGTAPFVVASTTKIANLNADLLDGADWAAPAALGSVTPAAVSATTLTTSSTVTLSGGTANGVAYLNGSKVLTTGSALTFDGTTLQVGGGVGLFRLNASASDYSLLKLAVAGTNYGSFGVGTGGEVVWNANSLHLWNVNSSEGMRLTSTGLGIGTSSPDVKLRITGANVANKGQLMLDSTNFSQMSFYNGATRYAQIYADVSGSNTGMYIIAATAQPMIFSTSDAERMRIDTSGNLGLGVTPSGWSSDYKALQLNGGYGSLASDATNGYVELVSNAYAYGNNTWKFISGGTYYATRYRAGVNGSHAWYTSSGTGTAGNAITFTQAMTLDASGRLGVGNTSPSYRIHAVGSGLDQAEIQSQNTGTTQDSRGTVRVKSAASTYGGGLMMTYSSDTAYPTSSLCLYNYDNQPLVFGTNNTERARIDSSGNLLVGTTSSSLTNSNSHIIVPNGSIYTQHISGTGSGATYYGFVYNAGVIGSITQNGTTGVLYNLTSDYRLKNNPTPVTGAKEFVMALQPKTWDWWDGSGKGVGFIAHEFMEVAKYSGNGEKDAVDENGNPVYQSIQPSSSEVMANLVALIQEQQTIIQQLQAQLTSVSADVAALKGN